MPRAAHAQASAAEALFEQGRAALTAGDLETACARFRGSEQIDPAAGTRANLAECEERRGKVATAWEAYRSALAKLPPGDARASVLEQRIKALEARLPKLTLVLPPSAPKDTTVRDGEVTIGTSATFGVPLPLDPGLHHLTVEAKGRASRPLDVSLTEGKTTTLAVEPGSPEVTPAPPPMTTSPVPGPPAPGANSGGPPSSAGPWVVGGIGLAGLVVGTVTGVLLLGDKSTANANCSAGPPPTCSTGTGMSAASAVRTLGPVTTVALGLGAAGVATGAIWLAVGRPGQAKVGFGIAPTYAGALARVEGTW
jgi:hypothetical protein